jgi:hypothetical protein
MRVGRRDHFSVSECDASLKLLGDGCVPTFKVAGLPTKGSPRIAFVTDGLKDGETTGNGTGTLAYFDGTAWRRVSDDTTVGA